jgi:hypothetical protein
MRTIVLAVLLIGAPALAKPLPKGMKVTVVNGRPMVVQGGHKVALLDGEQEGGDTIEASLSDDDRTIHVTWDRCGMGDPDAMDVIDEPMSHVTARFENLAGMAAHLKKKYDEASRRFAAAVAANPEPVFVTNLLSAQSMGGKLDDADHTIATWGPKMRAWFAWRLAVDSDLANVRTRAAATALAAARPGTAKASDLDGKLAIAGTLVATQGYQGNGGPGSPVETDVIVYDTAAQREVLRLPLATMEDACDPDGGDDAMLPKCTKRQLAAQAARTKAADAVLAALGMNVAAGAIVDPPADDKGELRSPDGKSKIVDDGGDLKVTAGGKTFETQPTDRLVKIGFANGQVLLELAVRHVYRCDDDSFRDELVTAAPDPAP